MPAHSQDAETKMQKTLEILRQDLQTFRTGRASPTVIEHIPVDYYGTPTPLLHIATISAPDARSLLIQPYDAKMVREIEHAIQKADLGFNPSNDGRVLRITVPPLSTERRRELAGKVKGKVEEAKVAIRNLRRDLHDAIKKQEKDHEISADDAKRAQEQLQKMTDSYVAETERIGAAKQAEIMEV